MIGIHLMVIKETSEMINIEIITQDLINMEIEMIIKI